MKIPDSEFKILVAEDNEMNQKVIKIILEKTGLAYAIANDGIEAITQFKSQKFNLILMDCQMPNLDGLSATRKIREVEKETSLQRIPIIALTANSMKGDRENCLEAGMDDFLSKPFRMNELVQVINTWRSKNV